MRAILVENPGPTSRLVLREVPSPALGAQEVRIRVRATAVNRADLLQRRGLYPPPPGASPVLGLECAGEIIEVGSEVVGWSLGQRAMALLAGGGYAEEAVVHAGSCLPVPAPWSWAEAGAFMETALTAYLNLFKLGGLQRGGRALVHGGSGGVGTAAIAQCCEENVELYVTAGSAERVARCEDLGASGAINYRQQRFAEVLADTPVDVILDPIGGAYFNENVRCLAPGGALVLIGLMGGARAEINLAPLLLKRLRVLGSTLRSRSAQEKGEIIAGFAARFGPALQAGRLAPVLHHVMPAADAEEAHARLQAGEVFGKLALTWD